ncbi:hypothetical protein Poli38472_003780 [Pythium oligandrum]|uniref:Ankyrin repeat protein n=1 Tax=Pythium oligandrum TaxID=41045 RepID=A0A8K1FJF5_PYTOL|nr:hypothetical protein Poli38472_003780 [Pythium oligandrum]|eukprot:TMW66015.1 hypothetical protein Poli38472_003780 [Pythium oligandrum]
MLLQLTRSLCHADPRLEGLEHVLLEVNELLDVSLAYTLPQAAASGCLPVFDRVANRVLQSGTDALVVMNLFGRAMEAAIHSKNLTMIKRIHQLFPAPLAVSSIRMAIESDDLELVQWMLAHRFDKTCWNKPPSELEDRRRCACCMKGLGVAGCAVRSWLHDEGYVAVDSWIGKRAALDGDLRTIEWLHQRQMPRQMLEDAFQPAIDHGHLHIVKFLHENGYTAHLRTITMTSGMVCDFPDLFAYLQDDMDMDVVVQALPPGLGACCRKNAWLTLSMAQKLGICITHGHLEALQWLTASNQRLIQDSDFVLCATDAGQLDVLKWLREQGAQFPMAGVLSTAASRGHLHIIKWLHELQSRGWSPQLMDLAASNGHMDVVEFLDEHRTEGCTTAAMDGAAQIGRLDIVQWLHVHRSEGCTTRAMDQAASGGHLNIVQWLHTNRTEGCTTNAMDSAAGWGHLDVVRWLHANRKEGCTTKAMDHAASLGFLDVVSWLHEHRQEGCTPHAMSNSSWDVAQWLRVHRGLGGSLEQTIRALGDGDVRLVEFLRTVQDAPEQNNDDRLHLATRSAEARLEGFEGVLHVLDELLDGSACYNPASAAASGSLRLLDRVARRVMMDKKIDPSLVANWFGKALVTVIRNKDLEMMQRIHNAHPDPLPVDSLNRAIETRDIKLFHWLAEHRYDGLCVTEPPARVVGRQTLNCCINLPSAQICLWLHVQGYVNCISWILQYVANDGDLETVRHIVEHDDPKYIDHAFLTVAAERGYFEVLQYLHEKGKVKARQWELSVTSAVATEQAASIRYLEDMMQAHIAIEDYPESIAAWYEENWRHLSKRERVVCAVSQGHLEATQWMLPRANLSDRGELCRVAASMGHLDILQFICEYGTKPTRIDVERAASTASENGHVHGLEWL